MLLSILFSLSADLSLVDVRLEHEGLTLVLRSSQMNAACPECAQPTSHAKRDLCECAWRCAALRAAHAGVRAPPLQNASRDFRARAPVAPCAKPRPSPRSPSRMAAKRGRSWPSAWPCLPVAIRGSRLIRSTEIPKRKTPRVLGLDDFAWKKGDRYGTILVDLEARCPVDLLANREAASVARWLREHPGVKLISRDRAGVYAEGAKRGAPRAKQIADRYHLLVNLRDTLKTTLARYQNVLPTLEEDGRKTGTSSQYTPEPPEAAPVADEPQQAEEQADEQQDQQQASANLSPLTAAERRRQISRANRYARYEQIIALHREGLSQRAIARQLHISRKVVHRSVAAGTFPERAPTGRRQSKLDPYLPAPLQALGRGLSQRPPTRA